ncbi:hypothetical protein [Amycolatopsis sp. cmx-4-61]
MNNAVARLHEPPVTPHSPHNSFTGDISTSENTSHISALIARVTGGGRCE